MKFLHTADWHLGKFVNGVSMLEDQRHLLKELLLLMEEEQIHTLVVSGDIYDRSIPPVEAIELFDWFLNILTERNIKGLFIGGNHDSAKRLSFAREFLESKGIYLESLYTETMKKVVLEEGGQAVSFFLLPYLEYQNTKQLDETVTNQNDGYRVYMEHNRECVNPEEINVLLAHGFFAYSEQTPATSGNSELRVGPSELVNAYFFDWFDYVALGHIHRPQRVGKEHYRYAGSLLKYSVDETKQKKSVTVVDLKGKGQAERTSRTLAPKRDFVTLKGTMEELEAGKLHYNREDYIFADILEDTLVYGAMERLRKVYPNILGLKFLKYQGAERKTATRASEIGKMDTEELFTRFYSDMTGEEISQDRLLIAREMIEEGEREDETN